MTQIATVKKVLPDGFVTVAVTRKSACAHDCDRCAGCGTVSGAVSVKARDPLGVRPGQKVMVESRTGQVLGIAALVYLLPLLGFLLGYFLSGGLAESVRYVLAAVAAALCFLPAILYDRRAVRRGSLEYTVRKVL